MFNLSSLKSPTRILSKFRIHLNILLREWEPVVLGQCVFTLGEHHLTQVQHMILLWIGIALLVRLISSTVKVNSGLLVVRSLVEQQPAAQVREAMPLERELNGTLTTDLAHEIIDRTQELGIDTCHTCTCTNLIYCTYS